MQQKDKNQQIMENKKKILWNLLPQTPRSEQFCNHVDSLMFIINPIAIELDDIFMFQ